MFNASSIYFLGQTHEILKGNYPFQTAVEIKAIGTLCYLPDCLIFYWCFKLKGVVLARIVSFLLGAAQRWRM